MNLKTGWWLLLPLALLASGQAGAQSNGYLYCGLVEPQREAFYSEVFVGRRDQIPVYAAEFQRFVERRVQLSVAARVGCDFSAKPRLVQRMREGNMYKHKSRGHRIVLTRWARDRPADQTVPSLVLQQASRSRD